VTNRLRAQFHRAGSSAARDPRRRGASPFFQRGRFHRTLRVAILAIVGLPLFVTASASVAEHASASTPSWSDQEVAATLNLNSAQVNSVSCVAGNFCAAGGSYKDANGNTQAFVAVFDGSSWSDQEVGATFNVGGRALVRSVSCVSSNFCVAGGSYTNVSGFQSSFTSELDGATWSDQATTPAPNAGNGGYINSVDCLSTTFCTAGGSYGDINGQTQAFVTFFNGTTWSGDEIAASLNAGASAYVYSLSCVSTTFCVAGGSYTDIFRRSEAFVSVFNGSTWNDQEVAATLSVGGTTAYAESVSCVSTTFCVASGRYTDGSSHAQAYVSVFNGATWSDQEIGATLNAVNVWVDSLSCVSATFCVTGGEYSATSGNHGFISVFNGTTWTNQDVADSLGTGSNASVFSVSCVSTTFCVAGGFYLDANSQAQDFVSVLSGGIWSDQEVGSSLNVGGGASMSSVSCVSTTFCVAGGSFTDASSHVQALVTEYELQASPTTTTTASPTATTTTSPTTTTTSLIPDTTTTSTPQDTTTTTMPRKQPPRRRVPSIRATAIPNVSPPGRQVTLIARGLPLAASGVVHFESGSTKLCSSKVTHGEARCVVPKSLKRSHYEVHAIYGGDSRYLPRTVVTRFQIT
jgi:hypothetical protein